MNRIAFAKTAAAGEYALKWTWRSCMRFAADVVRLQLHALAYKLANFLRTVTTPEAGLTRAVYKGVLALNNGLRDPPTATVSV